jgi:hypothetical protein
VQGKGEGLIRLGLQYRPIDAFSAREVQGARAGLLLIGVLGARNLRSPKGELVRVVRLFCLFVGFSINLVHACMHACDGNLGSINNALNNMHNNMHNNPNNHHLPKQLTSYAKLKCGKQDHKTPNVAKSASPRWTYDNKFTFYGATLAVRG